MVDARHLPGPAYEGNVERMLDGVKPLGDLDGVGLESRRGRGCARVQGGVDWHVERARRVVRVGVNRRVVVGEE